MGNSLSERFFRSLRSVRMTKGERVRMTIKGKGQNDNKGKGDRMTIREKGSK